MAARSSSCLAIGNEPGKPASCFFCTWFVAISFYARPLLLAASSFSVRTDLANMVSHSSASALVIGGALAAYYYMSAKP